MVKLNLIMKETCETPVELQLSHILSLLFSKDCFCQDVIWRSFNLLPLEMTHFFQNGKLITILPPSILYRDSYSLVASKIGLSVIMSEIFYSISSKDSKMYGYIFHDTSKRFIVSTHTWNDRSLIWKSTISSNDMTLSLYRTVTKLIQVELKLEQLQNR